MYFIFFVCPELKTFVFSKLVLYKRGLVLLYSVLCKHAQNRLKHMLIKW